MKFITHNCHRLDIDQAFQAALELLNENRFLEVAEICRKIVAVDPTHFRAHHGIGLGLHRAGESADAVNHIRDAITINPDYFEAYNNLGNIQRENGNFEDALNLFLKAKSLRPEAAIIHYNIGNLLKDLNRLDEALKSFKEAVRLQPDYIDARLQISLYLREHGNTEEAEAEYRVILKNHPEHCDTLYSLATLLHELHKPKEAHTIFKKLLSIKPDMHDALVALGNLLNEQANYGMDWALEEALECYCSAAALQPENYSLHITIGNLHVVRGEIDEALARYRVACALKPYDQIARSCFLMTSQYHPAPDIKALYEDALLWPQFCTADIPRTKEYSNSHEPDRPLRIGYVSADFKTHPVGFYILPALFHHNSDQFEVFCYSNSMDSDNTTKRIKGYSDAWRNVSDLNDEELHDQIARDKIDILIDLSGHTRGNRLTLFARKPAPVQATWIGYFFTTGLKEIDYILMDDTAVLAGEERYFTEKVIKLPMTRFCYEPPKYAPDVSNLPAYRNGYITFGCFNNLAKVTHSVIHLWARVLESVPDSHLFLKSQTLGSDSVKERITNQFAKEGISPERLLLRGASPHAEMLAEYGEMDIALDPFPFNGGLTSCEALWMGVPVITLFGNRPIARQTSGFLKTIELDGFTAKSEKEYVELAVNWSRSIDKLSEIRSSLRNKMNQSLLCNGKEFTYNIESTYRKIWQEWCSKITDRA